MENYNLPVPGVYRITAPDGRSYVGSSSNMAKRFSKYRNGKCEKQPKLHESILTYGFDSHHIEILMYCPKADLTRLERKYGEEYDVCGPRGLNMALPPDESGKMLISEEYREKLESRVMDEDTKQKISDSIKGRKLSDDHKKKIAASCTGRKHSPDTLLKLSEGRRGKNNAWSKAVKHIPSGKVYDTIGDAAWDHGISESTLARHLRNGKTDVFTYCNNDSNYGANKKPQRSFTSVSTLATPVGKPQDRGDRRRAVSDR